MKNLKNKLSSKLLIVSLAVLSLMAACISAGAVDATEEDVMTAITTGVGGLKTSLLNVLVVVIPAIIVIVGLTIGIKKGIGWFRSLTGR